MSDIRRFSSRQQRLDHAYLSQTLAGAKSYQRIAGYFRSSIFEWVGEEIGPWSGLLGNGVCISGCMRNTSDQQKCHSGVLR